MGLPKPPNPVKLIVGFIFKEEDSLKKAKLILEKHFGRIDFESEILDFNFTDYYEKEFGKDLKRQFISFKKLIWPQNLYKIKLITNKIEKKLSVGPNRQINIDPGYLDAARLILASTKDYCNRIYLNKGIYAQIMLYYRNKTFCPPELVYPDFKTDAYIKIFNQIREIYLKQIKTKK